LQQQKNKRATLLLLKIFDELSAFAN